MIKSADLCKTSPIHVLHERGVTAGSNTQTPEAQSQTLISSASSSFFLWAQSRNFSLNRAVSLCSDKRPNRVQLGRPSPCLENHTEKSSPLRSCTGKIKPLGGYNSTTDIAILLGEDQHVTLTEAHPNRRRRHPEG